MLKMNNKLKNKKNVVGYSYSRFFARRRRQNRQRNCADTTGTVLVRRAGHFQCYEYKYKYIYFFQIKYTVAILPNGTRKPLWLEITETLIAV